MKVKITRLLHKKVNTPHGEKIQVRIWTDQHKDRMLAGFMTKGMDGWKVGDEIEIEIEDTGKYLNFKLPDKSGEDLKQICDYVRKIEKRVAKLEQLVTFDKVKEGLIDKEETDEEGKIPF